MKYVEYLYNVEHAHKYGIVKIIPPESFRPALAFDTFSPQKLPTRYQVLQELSQGKVSPLFGLISFNTYTFAI